LIKPNVIIAYNCRHNCIRPCFTRRACRWTGRQVTRRRPADKSYRIVHGTVCIQRLRSRNYTIDKAGFLSRERWNLKTPSQASGKGQQENTIEVTRTGVQAQGLSHRIPMGGGDGTIGKDGAVETRSEVPGG